MAWVSATREAAVISRIRLVLGYPFRQNLCNAIKMLDATKDLGKILFSFIALHNNAARKPKLELKALYLSYQDSKRGSKMNVLERGQDFVKDIAEVNRHALSEYVDIQKDTFKKYVEANRERFAALREVKDINAFLDTQKHYYSTVQSSLKTSVRRQADLARHNFESTRDLVKNLISDSSDVAENVQNAVSEGAETVKAAATEAGAEVKAALADVSVAAENTSTEAQEATGTAADVTEDAAESVSKNASE